MTHGLRAVFYIDPNTKIVKGDGSLSSPYELSADFTVCSNCNGEGKVFPNCSYCYGKGYINIDCDECDSEGVSRCPTGCGGADPNCELCGGTDRYYPCFACDGTHIITTITCEECNGTGKENSQKSKCTQCGGRGIIVD